MMKKRGRLADGKICDTTIFIPGAELRKFQLFAVCKSDYSFVCADMMLYLTLEYNNIFL